LDIAAIERAVVKSLAAQPGVAAAFSRTDMLAGRVPGNVVVQRMLRSFHPERSGNVVIVQKPFWYLYPKPDTYSAMHGSPHTYDTHVPIVFAGPGMTRMRVARRVGPEDIAPTIAAYLGVPLPCCAYGDPLVEVLD
jgi:hypothetical protein